MFVPSLPKLAISGATRWLGPDKAVIQLSLRHRTDDQLWFSMFHEGHHVLKHKTAAIFIDAAPDQDGDPAEQEADRFARDTLIPPGDYARLVARGRPTLAQIRTFAREVGVSPGIVIGRLQFEQVLPYADGNALKVRLSWDFEE